MGNFAKCPTCQNSSSGTVYRCTKCGTIYCSSCKGFTMFSGPACPACDSTQYASVGKIKKNN